MGILINIFFFGTLLLFPLGEIFRIEITNGITVALNGILVPLTVLVWLFFGKNKKFPLAKQIFIFAFLCLFSLLLNLNWLKPNEAITSFLYLARWVSYAFLYFIVFSFGKRQKLIVLKTMVFIDMVFIFFGFVQYFYYPSLKNLYYLGWDEHMLRMFSTFLDPNFAGSFYVLGFILTAGFFLYEYSKKNRMALFYLLLSILNLACVFLTYSRSALLMLFFGSLVLFILMRKNFLILVLSSIIFIIFFIFSKNFNVENLNLFRVASSEARIDSAKNALVIIRENSVFGVGFNTYRYAQIKYQFRNKETPIFSHADAGTDNSFLFVFATTGIFGLTAYLYLLFSMCQKQFKTIKSKNNPFAVTMSIIFLSSMVGIMINAMFINSLFFPFILEWLWLTLGLTESN